mmetsp:Transcript_64081/g.139390  ORF Transcript_64081/g.139390 Transcript_64081/m.139390 type:complete len:208 (+) Transcript_64081:73-696(+)
MPIKQEVADRLTGHWQIGLFDAPCKDPMWFCYGCFCPCCAVIQQRWEILDVTGEPYICCGGMFAGCMCAGPLADPQDRNCMILEGCCCLGLAISGNRFMVQTRFNKENTACDDCILWTVCIISWVVCILRMVADVPDEIEDCVDCMIMIVQGCMLAQQNTELKYVKETGYMGPQPEIVGILPPHHQRFIQQGKPTQHAMQGIGLGAH